MLSDNPIETIEPEAFRLGVPHLSVFLLRTKLKMLNLESFIGLGGMDSKMLMTNRTVRTLKYQNCIIYLNPLVSDSEGITVRDPTFKKAEAYISSLLASGFRLKDEYRDKNTYIPCPLGTFVDPSTKGKGGCQKCPPGGFYSDTLGFVAKTCKRCPNGSFVAYDKTPGKQHGDCKSCPLGTETDFFAGNRACKCLEGQYRTHMFKECFKCGQGGLKCQDDYASLKSGHWWEWRNKSHNDRYKLYIKNLLTSSPALDVFHVQYPFPIPTPYKCPTDESCKGGLDSPCENGYEGPLCSVCSSGYYKQLTLCTRCPSKKWIIAQLSIITIIVLIIVAVSVWTSRRKIRKKEENFLIDKFFSKVKIVIGFYQVTYGLLELFSYIKWPGSLETIAKYSGFLQLNVLQIAPIQCLFPGLHLDAFGSLFATTAMNFAVICLAGVGYGLHKLIISRNHSLEEEEKSRRVSQSKELVYKNVFFFLYVTYLSTCSKTVNVLPPACRKLCRDDKEAVCSKYLKADYSVPCDGQKYNHMLVVAYISIAYIFALPAASFIALWRQRRAQSATEDAKKSQDITSGKEMINGLRFLFENYKARSWYWELVETTRKVILTSGLTLVGQESRSYIGLALVIAGMYGIVFSWIKPIQDSMENKLMAASLAVTVVNLVIGSVSKIPSENVTGWIGPDTDAILFKILVFAANSMVIGLLVVQYALHLYGYVKEWVKNPHWSFTCCLALLLPLNDLQGEIRGLAGTNVLNTQLQTGEFGMVTFETAVRDSGALDVTLKEVYEADHDTEEEQDNSLQGAKNNDQKCDQWTQTELFSIPV
ncbi:cysteine repeat modular protein A-like isoform X2 [Oculina patagonica]